MSIFILRQQTVRDEPLRVATVMAGDREEALYRAELEYGGDWQVMETHPTLEDLQNMVEDSPTEAVLLNI